MCFVLLQNLENSLHSIVGNLWIRKKKKKNLFIQTFHLLLMQGGHRLPLATNPRSDSCLLRPEKWGENWSSGIWPFSRHWKLQSPCENNDYQGILGIWERWVIWNFEFWEPLNKSPLLSIKQFIYEEWSCHVVWIHPALGMKREGNVILFGRPFKLLAV